MPSFEAFCRGKVAAQAEVRGFEGRFCLKLIGFGCKAFGLWMFIVFKGFRDKWDSGMFRFRE